MDDVRAVRRDSCNSINPNRPTPSGSGSKSTSSRPRRIASADKSTRVSDEPDDARYPSLNTRYTTRNTLSSRCGNSSDVGTSYGMRASRIFAFARTMRWASVGAPLRNACAISSVVRPHTSRSVSATCASDDNAG